MPESIDRDYRVKLATHDEGSPVPRPLLYCPDEGIVGYQPGRLCWDAEMPAAVAGDRQVVYSDTNRLLAAPPELNAHALGRADSGRTDSYAEHK